MRKVEFNSTDSFFDNVVRENSHYLQSTSFFLNSFNVDLSLNPRALFYANEVKV